jgi:hypothetical protein
LAVAALVLAPMSTVRAHGDEKETTTFGYKTQTKWNINLPKETFKPVSGEIPIAHAGGTGFKVEIDGTALAVDCNADGKLDEKAKGTAGSVTLKGKSPRGGDLLYSVRLVNQGGWRYAAGGFMTGTVKGVTIKLIDQDGNGAYNDYGVDAMVVGTASAASFLSKVVNLNGSLFDLEVSADGAEVSVSPYAGASGTLNIEGAFESKGNLDSAIVIGASNDVSFNLAGAKKGLLVPAGNYTLAYGTVSQGAESVRMRAGRMKPFVVAENAVASPKLGGPIAAEFTYTHVKGVLTIKPTDLFFFGAAGEEYYNWIPDGQPPTFVVKDAKTGEEILKARFGGC